MKPNRTGLCLLTFSIVILLCALSCSSPEKALSGRWETFLEDEGLGSFSLIWRFTEEGEIYLEQGEEADPSFSIPFATFQVEGEEIVITSEGKESVYTFSVNDNSLILSQEGEEPLKFDRV